LNCFPLKKRKKPKVVKFFLSYPTALEFNLLFSTLPAKESRKPESFTPQKATTPSTIRQIRQRLLVPSTDMFNMEIVRVKRLATYVKPKSFLRRKKRFWEHPRFWLLVRIALFLAVIAAVILLFPKEAW